jgi:hypothetical protein
MEGVRPGLALSLLVSLAAGGCARHAAGQATSAAMEKLGETATAGAPPGERPVAAATGRVVDAAVAHMQQPEQLAALEKIAAATAAEVMKQSLRVATTSDDRGKSPVADLAAAATDGALRRLFPQCSGDDPSCLDRRIAELSRQAAVGFTTGARDTLALPALLLAFIAGVVAVLLVLLGISSWQTRARARAEAHSPVRAS